MTPQSIASAPESDAWLLLYDPGNTGRHAPWVIGTRCDEGWCDEEGYTLRPSMWLSLPNPQPQGSGWRLAEGHVEVAPANGINHDWRGWLVSVVKPDGNYDAEREPSMHASLSEARAFAVGRAERLGLPIIEHEAKAASNIIFLGSRKRP